LFVWACPELSRRGGGNLDRKAWASLRPPAKILALLIPWILGEVEIIKRAFGRTRMSDPHVIPDRRHSEVPRFHQRDEESGVQRHRPESVHARSLARLVSAPSIGMTQG
jgi:hypothetical protein